MTIVKLFLADGKVKIWFRVYAMNLMEQHSASCHCWTFWDEHPVHQQSPETSHPDTSSNTSWTASPQPHPSQTVGDSPSRLFVWQLRCRIGTGVTVHLSSKLLGGINKTPKKTVTSINGTCGKVNQCENEEYSPACFDNFPQRLTEILDRQLF